MASDIIIHKAHLVPVGKDQEQNLEMARTFARRFNRMYNVELFPTPRPYVFEGKDMVKIPGLDGSGKMGKSEGNAISLADSPQVIRKKVMKAVTDSGPVQPNQEKPEVIQNLFSLLEVVSEPDVVSHFDLQYNDCSIRYGDLKKQLAEDIIKFTSPIRERIESLLADDAYLSKVARMGAEKARASASRTLLEVKEVIGVKKFY
jgi:tryptophanyl-tRNA synthetase